MFLDDLHSEGLGDGRARERNAPERPVADREVPLGPRTSAIAEAVHAWLDGDATESQARRAEAREVDFWKRLDDDLSARRRMRTPVHVQAQIMNALPMHAPKAITPWWRRELVVTPAVAVAAAVALVAAAVVGTLMVMR